LFFFLIRKRDPSGRFEVKQSWKGSTPAKEQKEEGGELTKAAQQG
jgi:hypothetical protein